MRPIGEVRLALMHAAEQLATDGHAPTLRELAQAACVGYDKAMVTVKNMTAAGQLEKRGTRRVDYRNKPVAEYAPAKPRPAREEAYVDVAAVFAVWGRT